MKPTDWFVLDMDDGVLRRAATRKQAVSWLCGLHLTERVISRNTSGPGDYEYIVGNDPEDSGQAWVIHGSDRVAAHGWNPDQQPLYPDADFPYDRVDRPEDSTT
jgi:hypothetical protein